MEFKPGLALIMSALVLAACGGGGGGGGAAPTLLRTTISGTATPPAAPVSGAVAATATVTTPPNSTGTWPSIVQGADYMYDAAGLNAATMKFTVTSITVKPVDTATGSTTITTGAAYPADAALGQTTGVSNTVGGATQALVQAPGGPIPGILTPNDFGTGLASVSLVAQPTLTTFVAAGYALPFSAALSPAGYTYQTFGTWGTIDKTTGASSEYYFSTGAPTVAASLPVTGKATYTGYAIGSYVDATTRDPATIQATMSATADFAALSVAFSTTGSTSQSLNAPVGAPQSAHPGLDLNGTLNFAAGSNTFTGVVTSANGMSGNATGRFYGPGIAAATPTKVVGAPPEIGGTFAVMGVGGAMQGAFGGK